MNDTNPTIEGSPIPEPTGCVCCGKETEGFTVCVECGADMFIYDYADPMEYCKDKNPERFEMIMNWYNQQKENECQTK